MSELILSQYGKVRNYVDYIMCLFINPPASAASREVANLTERKNIHTPYMVSENLSVCPYVCCKFDLNYLRTGKIEVWLPELFLSACFHPF